MVIWDYMLWEKRWGREYFPGNRILGHLTTIGIVHNVIGGIGTGALLISPFVLLKKYQKNRGLPDESLPALRLHFRNSDLYRVYHITLQPGRE